MEIIQELIQGSIEWHKLRSGKISGTKLDDVMGSTLARVQLAAELIAQSGTEQSDITNPTLEMQRGIEEEEFALKLFEATTGKTVERIGACVSSEYDWLMLSPDGLIKNKDGKYTEAVEVKCPKSATAIFYKMVNLIPQEELKLTPAQRNILGVPADYIWQVVHYFIVNKELEKLYFVVYDVRFIEEQAKLYTVEVERNNLELQEMITKAEIALQAFRVDWLRWQEVISPSNF